VQSIFQAAGEDAGRNQTKVIRLGDDTYMLFPLPGYGHLVLGKAGDPLSRPLLGTLTLIANKLALACIACEQAHAVKAAHEELEQRVAQRTAALSKANRELENTLQTLQQAQGELVRSEKLASIGRLVAGVAHELNTPIGNGLMAVSTLESHHKTFTRALAEGLRRSTLDDFVNNVGMASQIATRNLNRAADLVTSFKQVAVDQTSSQRRIFDLKTVTGEILTAMHPTLSRSTHAVREEIEKGLCFDSFPGPLGQVIGNLIENAIKHGFDGRSGGIIVITGTPLDAERVALTLSDNGCGIPHENLARIFDPFFTTRLGQGGSGLGLNIVHNIVTGVLCGSLDVSSTVGEGTSFRLVLPRVPPAETRSAAA
jgi:signal transduction histidine kinase